MLTQVFTAGFIHAAALMELLADQAYGVWRNLLAAKASQLWSHATWCLALNWHRS